MKTAQLTIDPGPPTFGAGRRSKYKTLDRQIPGGELIMSQEPLRLPAEPTLFDDRGPAWGDERSEE